MSKWQAIAMKFIFRLILLISTALILSHCATNEQKMTSQVLEINDKINSFFKNPPKGEFFSHSFLNEKILFISREEKLLLAMHKGEVGPLPYDKWEAKIPKLSAGFSILEDEKQNILIIHLDKNKKRSTDQILHTVLHEGFHAFVQLKKAGWKKHKKNQGRGTIYPILNLPRYYRWEMQQALLSYFETFNEENLQHYSYWYWKWRSQFLEEYRSYTDRLEGTTEYFSQAAMARIKKRDSSTRDLINYYRQTKIGRMKFKEEFDLSSESYHLGPLVGFALDKVSKSDWQKKVYDGASPFDLLEKKFLRKKAKIRSKVQGEFLRLSVREMMKIDGDGKLQQIISDLANPTTHRLILPLKESKTTSFAASNFFRPFFNFKNLKNVHVVALASPFSIIGKKWQWEFKNEDYWIRADKTPCTKENATILVFNKKSVKYSKGLLTFLEKQKTPIKVKRKKLGHTYWYCAL